MIDDEKITKGTLTQPNQKPVTAEPTVSSGLVYFPIYKPSSSVNKCSLGDAFIWAAEKITFINKKFVIKS